MICDDIPHQLQVLGRTVISQDDIYDYGLYLLDNILHDSSHALNDFPSMPLPSQNFCHWFTIAHNHLIAQQTNYNVLSENIEAEKLYASLNNCQKDAFHCILQSIENNHGQTFFIDGYGGTGKTYLYETICHAIHSKGMIVICCINRSCVLLPGGQTARIPCSRFQLKHWMLILFVTFLNKVYVQNSLKQQIDLNAIKLRLQTRQRLEGE